MTDATPTRLPPYRPALQTVVLGAAIIASVVGTISAVVPSMAWSSKRGVIMWEYGLSRLIAPALFAAIVIVAARALRPSRRRLHWAAGTILGASPLLFGIRIAHLPWFDIDSQFVVLAPWALRTFVACVLVLLGAGIALLVYARQWAPEGEALVATARARR